MNIIAIVQARMGSTRLPGKVLHKMGSSFPVIELIYRRLSQSKRLNRIIVGTTVSAKDDELINFLEQQKIPFFRGSESDVLDRYYQISKAYQADVVVRITGDCPFIDSQIVDRIIDQYMDKQGTIAYASNVHPPTYPDGLDIEVFSEGALERAWQEAKWLSEREHVTPYIHKNTNLFSCVNVEYSNDLSNYRWTLDEQTDYEFLQELARRIELEGYSLVEISFEQIVHIMKKYPYLMSINRNITRNEGAFKSLLNDRLIEERLKEG